MKNEEIVIFLDVDGVLNHLYAWNRDGFDTHHFLHFDEKTSTNYRVGVNFPDWMPELVQHLVENYEVHWLTTWRHKANEQLAPILGIPELPVITDGTGRRIVDWKPNAAFSLASDLLAQGKRVIWIEDFYGRIPVNQMPYGMEFIDTGAREGLFGDDIPFLLTPELVDKTRAGLDAAECMECFVPFGRHRITCSKYHDDWVPACGTCLAPADFHETWCKEFELQT